MSKAHTHPSTNKTRLYNGVVLYVGHRYVHIYQVRIVWIGECIVGEEIHVDVQSRLSAVLTHAY